MNFNDRVLRFIQTIPKGKVMTYKSVAHALNSKAYRAVGQALKSNTRPVVVPCHRVVCSDGYVGGYDGLWGSHRKIKLLRKEGVVVRNERIDLERFEHHPAASKTGASSE